MKLPRRNSKRYKAIIANGCSINVTQCGDYGYEMDCNYNYPWVCDKCPCVEVLNVKQGSIARQIGKMIGKTQVNLITTAIESQTIDIKGEI